MKEISLAGLNQYKIFRSPILKMLAEEKKAFVNDRNDRLGIICLDKFDKNYTAAILQESAEGVYVLDSMENIKTSLTEKQAEEFIEDKI